MSELPHRPSPEDEALWRRRFGIFALLRISGLILMIVGLAIGFTGFIRPGGWPVVGGLIAIAGFVEGMVLPQILRRRWAGK